MFYLDKSKITSSVWFFGCEAVNLLIIGLLYYALFYWLHDGWKLLVFVAVMVIQDSDWFEVLSLDRLDVNDDFDPSSGYALMKLFGEILAFVVVMGYMMLAVIALYQGFVGLGFLKVTIH